MGFWKKLFGLENKTKAKLDVYAVDLDGDGKVQDGTVWERPASMTVDLDKTLEKVEELLKEVAPGQELKVSDNLAKKAKTQAKSKKAAATRASKPKTETKKTPSAKKPAAPKKPAAKTTKKK